MLPVILAFLGGLIIGLLFRINIYKSSTQHHQSGDITQFMEDVEHNEQPSPQTLLLGSIKYILKGRPVTYKQLQDMHPALSHSQIKKTLSDLRSKGMISVRDAGASGNYYYVNDMDIADE